MSEAHVSPDHTLHLGLELYLEFYPARDDFYAILFLFPVQVK